jgi:hypothetical protein
MGITRVAEQWTGRNSEFGDAFDRKYTRKFVVETDKVAASSILVTYATGIPRLWSPYFNALTGEVDYLARCRRVSAMQRDEAPLVWDVTCEYETGTAQPAVGSGVSAQSGPSGDPNKPGGGGAADNPDQRPPKRRWRQQDMELPLDRALDRDGLQKQIPIVVNGVVEQLITDRWVPVLNAAGQRFDPFPTYRITFPVLEITRIELSYDPEIARDYSYAVNQDQFLFAKPGQAQMLPIDSDEVWIGGLPYWETTYRIRFAPTELADWQPEILNAGTKQLQGNPVDKTKPAVAIIDKMTMQPVHQAVPLDEFGKEMGQSQILAGPLTYCRFMAYRALSFAALNLPI